MSYLQAKKSAKLLYKKIGKIDVAALDGESVSFTRVGFDHLIRKGRVKRNKKEQFHRFGLLKYVAQILQNKNVTILYRENKRNLSIAKFWTFVEVIQRTKIKLVVRQVGDGSKHFFSIMGSRTKKSPK
ncbi:MAG: hypothetical protein Q7S14_03155 [bacterium]|nr:hypothetical protein [bacterium]